MPHIVETAGRPCLNYDLVAMTLSEAKKLLTQLQQAWSSGNSVRMPRPNALARAAVAANGSRTITQPGL